VHLTSSRPFRLRGLGLLNSRLKTSLGARALERNASGLYGNDRPSLHGVALADAAGFLALVGTDQGHAVGRRDQDGGDDDSERLGRLGRGRRPVGWPAAGSEKWTVEDFGKLVYGGRV
jgi:hypothetical protein